MDGFPTPAKRNKTLGRARNSTPQEEIWPQQNRGDKRARNFAGANNTKLFRSKYAPEILMSDDTEGFVTGASGFRLPALAPYVCHLRVAVAIAVLPRLLLRVQTLSVEHTSACRCSAPSHRILHKKSLCGCAALPLASSAPVFHSRPSPPLVIHAALVCWRDPTAAREGARSHHQ